LSSIENSAGAGQLDQSLDALLRGIAQGNYSEEDLDEFAPQTTIETEE